MTAGDLQNTANTQGQMLEGQIGGIVRQEGEVMQTQDLSRVSNQVGGYDIDQLKKFVQICKPQIDE